MSFQSLRPGDANGTFPIVAPLIEGRYEPDWAILGGRIELQGGGVVLQRDRAILTDTGPGDDQRRATLGGDWQGTYTFYNGIRLQPFVEARGDLYNTLNPYQTVGSDTVTYPGAHTVERFLGTAGVDASWPFYRRSGDMTVTLEPLVQLAASPRANLNPYITNEDSQVFELDETNLFDYNKSPGFDYYEGGYRANVGGRMTLRFDDGATAQILVGRSLRTQYDPTLPASTSLERTASDWVLAASVQPSDSFSGFTRALLDSQTGQVSHLEVGVNGAIARANGYVRYYFDDVDPTLPKTQNIQAGGQVLITRRWGFILSANWDLAAHVAVQEQGGLLYQDDCLHLELLYQHDGTYDLALRPSDRILIRLLLPITTGSGYQRPDFR
jgi:LPS-assembly protein